MIFCKKLKKSSQHFIKSLLKICLISQISVQSLWHVSFSEVTHIITFTGLSGYADKSSAEL